MDGVNSWFVPRQWVLEQAVTKAENNVVSGGQISAKVLKVRFCNHSVAM